MSSPLKRTFSLPSEQVGFSDSLVASGACPSGSEVVRAGLEALQDRDATIEQWLRDEVAPAYDAMQADPSSAIPMEDVFAALRAHHAEQMAEKPREP